MEEYTRRQRIFALVGVLFALTWPLLSRWIGGHRDITSGRDDLRTVVIEWSVVAVLAALAFGAQRLRPVFFRITMFGWLDLLSMLGVLVATYAVTGLVSRFAAHPTFNIQQLGAIPLAIRVILPITAGVCEEFIFRGFVIEEIGLLTGMRWIGAALSVIFFGLGHVGTYGFSTAVFLPMTIGLMITLLYIWRNNLPLCMLMHAIIDAVSLLLVPALPHP